LPAEWFPEARLGASRASKKLRRHSCIALILLEKSDFVVNAERYNHLFGASE
jgi:hypothetical protein